MLLYVRARAEPPTAADAASELRIAPAVARWRLERLAAAGLVVPAFRPPDRPGPGAGRPAKTYAIPAEATQIEFPRRRYDALIRLLVAALPARARSARLRAVGVGFGGELADAAAIAPVVRPHTAARRVCAALGAIGFQASVESASADEIVIATPTCPLRPLVAEEPRVRDVDAGMWRALIAAALRDVEPGDVRCATHGCAGGGACRIVLTLER